MLFMVTLVHTPEQCFGRKEYAAESKRWFKEMSDLAKKLGIRTEGAYVAPNEHIFYFILESDDFKAVSEFLGPPMLTHTSAKISPILTAKEAFGLPFIERIK